MEVRVKKQFELHSNHIAYEDDILDLITINYECGSFFVILEKYGHIFNVYFKDEFDINDHLEFDYQGNKLVSADVLIAESEVRKMVEEAREEGYKEAERWKEKFMKLLDKI